MRLHHLLEKTSTNIKVLDIVASDILQNASQMSIRPNDYATFKVDHELVDRVREYGDKYVAFVEYLAKYVPVHIVNKFAHTKGAYSHYPDHKNPMGDAIDITTHFDPDSEPETLRRGEIQNNPHIKSTVMHELRHVMQRTQFGEFYAKHATDMSGAITKDAVNDYKKDPLEIDASFVDIINTNSGEEDPRKFVKAVMDRLSNIKNLTPRQYEHYKRKTAAYINDRSTPEGKPTQTPKQRLKARRDAKKEVFNSYVRDAIPTLGQLSSIGMGSNYNTSFPTKVLLTNHHKLSSGEVNITIGGQFVLGCAILNQWIKTDGSDYGVGDIVDNAVIPKVWFGEARDMIQSNDFFKNKDRELMIDWVNAFQKDYDAFLD